LQGLVGIQVDDSLILGDARFVEDEQREVQRFKCKDTSVLGTSFLEFNGAEIHRLANNKLIFKQPNHIQRLAAATNLTEFVSQRALGAYIACMSRPDLLGEFQLLASAAREPTEANIKTLNKIIDKARGTASLGLSFCCLDLDGDLRVVAFSDAGFASHEDKSSQLGYVILLVDQHDHANIIAYASKKCRRVTRSDLASEMFALVEAFDVACALAQQLQEIMGQKPDVWNVIESQTVYNIVVRFGNMTEKRLAVDASMLREAHMKKAMTRLLWVPSRENAADVMTKPNVRNEVFDALIVRNELLLNPTAWIDRDGEQKFVNAGDLTV
jgi:hypothetical protein